MNVCCIINWFYIIDSILIVYICICTSCCLSYLVFFCALICTGQKIYVGFFSLKNLPFIISEYSKWKRQHTKEQLNEIPMLAPTRIPRERKATSVRALSSQSKLYHFGLVPSLERLCGRKTFLLRKCEKRLKKALLWFDTGLKNTFIQKWFNRSETF